MDSRLHERLALNLEARIANLTHDAAAVTGELIDVSASGICVRFGAPVVPGDLLRVDFSDGSLFGQVVYTNPNGRCGVEVFDVLVGVSNLGRLIRQTLESGRDPRSLALRESG
jgi:hypothetical protein